MRPRNSLCSFRVVIYLEMNDALTGMKGRQHSPKPATYLHSGGKRLSTHDQNFLRKLIPIVANRFVAADYALDEHAAWGLLQHSACRRP